MVSWLYGQLLIVFSRPSVDFGIIYIFNPWQHFGYYCGLNDRSYTTWWCGVKYLLCLFVHFWFTFYIYSEGAFIASQSRLGAIRGNFYLKSRLFGRKRLETPDTGRLIKTESARRLCSPVSDWSVLAITDATTISLRVVYWCLFCLRS